VTRFFQQSLPNFCSNFTKLRKKSPNVGFPNDYVIIMPKNNSYVIKVEKICTKRYLEILVAFIVLQFLLMIRLYFLGLAVLFTTLNTLLNKKHTFLPKWLLIIKTFQILPKFYQKKLIYQIFLKIHEILPKVKRFTKSGHTGRIKRIRARSLKNHYTFVEWLHLLTCKRGWLKEID
jgi:hypothetical protein